MSTGNEGVGEVVEGMVGENARRGGEGPVRKEDEDMFSVEIWNGLVYS